MGLFLRECPKIVMLENILFLIGDKKKEIINDYYMFESLMDAPNKKKNRNHSKMFQ
jgi:hypothetical protein